jgi:hypothetical protein
MHRDFKELLSAFNTGKVRYLIVGGYAVSYHAQRRATKELDILIGADAENSKGVYAALAKFGAPIEGLSPKDFAEPDNLFRMGTPPVMPPGYPCSDCLLATASAKRTGTLS